MTIRYKNELNYTHDLISKQNELHRNKRVLECISKHLETTIDSVGRSFCYVDMPQEVCARCDNRSRCHLAVKALERNTY